MELPQIEYSDSKSLQAQKIVSQPISCKVYGV